MCSFYLQKLKPDLLINISNVSGKKNTSAYSKRANEFTKRANDKRFKSKLVCFTLEFVLMPFFNCSFDFACQTKTKLMKTKRANDKRWANDKMGEWLTFVYFSFSYIFIILFLWFALALFDFAVRLCCHSRHADSAKTKMVKTKKANDNRLPNLANGKKFFRKGQNTCNETNDKKGQTIWANDKKKKVQTSISFFFAFFHSFYWISLFCFR